MAKNGSFGFAKGWLVWRAKPNVPFVRLGEIVFKKVRKEKNKKHRVGNECRLTRCPFVVSFVCLCSPVKMVYFSFVFSRLFVVVGSSFTLAANSRIHAIKELLTSKNTGIYACLLRFIGNELDILRPWGYFGKGQNTKSLLVEVFSVAQ